MVQVMGPAGAATQGVAGGGGTWARQPLEGDFPISCRRVSPRGPGWWWPTRSSAPGRSRTLLIRANPESRRRRDRNPPGRGMHDPFMNNPGEEPNR